MIRLLAWCALLFVGVFAALYSPRASAATYSQAMASCQAYMGSQAYRDNFVTGNSSQYFSGMRCAVGPAASGTGCTAQTVCMRYTDSRNPSYQAVGSVFPFTGSAPPPVNPCQQAWPATTINTSGKVTAGSSTCSGAVPDGGGAGGTVQCALSINPESPPTVDPQTGNWSTWVTVGASGNTCGASNTDVTDGNGDKINPTPFIPTLPPTTVTPPPSLCTGGACYDPKADQYCGSSGGVQFCVPGSAARTAAGGCGSGGSGTMCAGTPNAPQAPQDKVPDPATEVKTSDNFTQADPTTGQVIPVNVVVWATQGTPTNGAKDGDSVPPSASTSPTPPTTAKSYGGGTDCKTPPACSGDAVMCGAARTQWATTCQVHKDLAGTDTPPTEAALADGSKYNQASLWPDRPASGDPLADAANAGNYDQTGFAGGSAGTCPMHDMAVPLWGGKTFNVPFSKGCTPLGWLRYLVIGFALFAAAKITMGSNS